MMKALPVIWLSALLLVATGCAAVARRRLQTLARLDYSASTERGREGRDMAYRAVEQSTPRTLRTPHIYDVAFQFAAGYRTNGLLVVRWVADDPTADGALLWLSDGQQVAVDFLDGYIEQNRKDAEDLVLFYATVGSDDAPEVWRTLNTNTISAVALSLR